MNEPNRNDLVNYRIKRAKETLSETHAMIEKSFWNAAVNRLYYACYYSVTALLMKHNINAQTHTGVCRMFGLHFIKTGIISQELGIFYSKLFDKRQTGDYDDFIEYNKETLDFLLPLAKELIETIEGIINNPTSRYL